MERIQTARILLRGFETTDVSDFFFYAKHPEVGPNAGWTPHESRWETKQILSQMIRSGSNWAIVEKTSGRVIGSFSVIADRIRVALPGYYEIGYVLGKPWWGKGYMTEIVSTMVCYLFEEKNALMVSARCNPDNERSANVLRKNGFWEEGTLRHTRTKNTGEVQDTVYFSMLKKEFQELK